MEKKYHVGCFNDERLEKAGVLLCQSMVEQQNVCLRKLGVNNAERKQFSRFLANPKVKLEEISENVSTKICEAVKALHVLVIQDTTELNYQKHADRTKDFGPVGNGKDLGCFLHPGLVVNAKDSTCLGLSSVLCWQRTWEPKKDRKTLPIEEKESYRWLETGLLAKERLKLASLITIVADRESDIYEEWARIPDEKTHLLTRACRNRKTREGLLYEVIAGFESVGTYEFEVKARKQVKGKKKRSAHCAKLEIRFGEVTILTPGNSTDKEAPESITLRSVEVKELPASVVEGEDPIHWRLLTTHEVTSIEDALQIVRWYSERWNIEQLFRTLKKQGLNIESSQIESGYNIQKLAVIAVYVATMIIQMVMAREGKDQSISVVFDEQECEVMTILVKKLEGKTEKQKNPHPPDCLSWASWVIGRLGGWSGYKSESPPGPITMLEGFQKFDNILQGWRLAKDVYSD